MSFSRFGIDHLSPSSINRWRDTPGLWCLRYLAKVWDDGSPAMHRGTAVERGLERILRERDGLDELSYGVACDTFAQLTNGETSDEIEAERNLLAGMVHECAKWRAPGELAASQLKIETWLEGVSVPVIGYIDFTFMDGPDVDLKTTKRCPSEPSPDHVRQVALYWKARERPAALLYVTDKRHAFYPIPEDALRYAVDELAASARSLERFLSFVPDVETAIRSMPHPLDHYAYGEATKAKVMELS